MIKENFIGKDLLNKLAKKHDTNWDKVMKLAEENGFITQAFGGTAVLVSNKEQIKNYGYEKYQEIQETNSTINQIKEFENEEELE